MAASALHAQFAYPRGFWGALAGHLMAMSNAHANRWVLDQLSMRASDHVLEIGAGPGVGLALASEMANAGLVIGVDISPTMLRQAARRNAAAVANGRVDLRLVEDETLPVGDGSIDKLFSVNTVQLLDDLDGSIREMRRVLRPTGIAALAVQPREPGATAETSRTWARRLNHAMRAAGFVAVSEHLGPPERLPIACAIGRRPAG